MSNQKTIYDKESEPPTNGLNPNSIRISKKSEPLSNGLNPNNLRTSKKVKIPRVIVITGGSSGIGKQLVNNFVEAGDIVYSLSRTNECGFINHIDCDLLDKASIDEAFNVIASEVTQVDILINNAGIGISGATELLPFKEVEKVFDIDTVNTLYLTRHFLKLMQRSAKIVFISSACALFALPFRAVYCAAKSALNMIAYGLRMELRQSGIDVVTICPGDIKSNFTKNRKKYWETSDRYGDRVKTAAEKVDSKEHKRMNLIKSGKKIYRLAAKKRGALYIVGKKYKILQFFQRILPVGLYLKLTEKIFS